MGLVSASTLAAVVACSSEPAPQRPRPTPAGPYVVTAIDYHFHDAHPSLPIALDRGVEFSNQGSNIHNVTIEETGYAENIRPGERIAIEPVSELLSEPGEYPFFCKFHADRGMSGVLVLID